MCENGSVTQLVCAVKEGSDPDAVQSLYERYIRQLEWSARGKMGGLSRRVVDEEDLASTVMGQFFLAVRTGRFPRIDDRHDLWQVLLMILDRRIVDCRRRGKTRRQEVGESVLMPLDPESSARGGANEVPESAPTPLDVVALRDELTCRLQQLPQERWRQVAVWKMEQRSHAEIAKMLDCSLKTVERILGEIRKHWQPAEQ